MQSFYQWIINTIFQKKSFTINNSTDKLSECKSRSNHDHYLNWMKTMFKKAWTVRTLVVWLDIGRQRGSSAIYHCHPWVLSETTTLWSVPLQSRIWLTVTVYPTSYTHHINTCALVLCMPLSIWPLTVIGNKGEINTVWKVHHSGFVFRFLKIYKKKILQK